MDVVHLTFMRKNIIFNNRGFSIYIFKVYILFFIEPLNGEVLFTTSSQLLTHKRIQIKASVRRWLSSLCVNIAKERGSNITWVIRSTVKMFLLLSNFFLTLNQKHFFNKLIIPFLEQYKNRTV